MNTSNKTFRCQLITPERAMFDDAVGFAAVTAHDGEIGFLPHRAPLICRLGLGELRVEVEGNTQHFFIDGGFAQMADDEFTVLTQRAMAPADLDLATLRSELETTRGQHLDASHGAKQQQRTIARLTAQIAFAERHGSKQK